jgi:hypothetical protein
MHVPFGITSLLALAGVCLSQTVAAPPPPSKASRELTPAQLAQRLDQVKKEILPKTMTAKMAADPQKVKKYLSDWHTVTSDHYLLFTNGPEATCRKYATTLEKLYGFVKKELPFDDIDHLLTCYIFATREEYYAYSVQFAGWSEEEAKASAGHATSQYYATYYESPTAPVVFHEATHQVVGACIKVEGVGSWFQEGLAMYFEKKTSGEKPAGTIKTDIKNHDYYPLPEFFAIAELISDPKGHAHRNYDHSGALIDFLINTNVPPVAHKFGDLLKAARAVNDQHEGAKVSAKLIHDVYGLTVPELEEKWREHLGLK